MRSSCRRCGQERERDGRRGYPSRFCQRCAPVVAAQNVARAEAKRVAKLCPRDADGRPRHRKPAHANSLWQMRAHRYVKVAIRSGLLPDLRKGQYACADCGLRAVDYEHRDYSRPLDVEPVCRVCNKLRGTASWPTADRYQFAKVAHASLPAQQRKRAGLVESSQGRGPRRQSPDANVISTPQHRERPAAYAHQNDEFFES